MLKPGISNVLSVVIRCVLGLCIGNAYGRWSDNSNGTFYIAVTPTFANGRICYATNPAGPWRYCQPDRNIYDPELFIDTDETGYIIAQ